MNQNYSPVFLKHGTYIICYRFFFRFLYRRAVIWMLHTEFFYQVFYKFVFVHFFLLCFVVVNEFNLYFSFRFKYKGKMLKKSSNEKSEFEFTFLLKKTAIVKGGSLNIKLSCRTAYSLSHPRHSDTCSRISSSDIIAPQQLQIRTVFWTFFPFFLP